MARIEPLKKNEVQGQTREIFDAMEKQFGMVPNLFATIARYPQALKPLIDLYQAISKESSIDPKLQELANLETSQINKCNYCFSHHSQMAKVQGVSEEQISCLTKEKINQRFSDKEKTVIEYASAVTRDAEKVPDKLFSRLKSYFSNGEIVNLTLIIGLMNVFNQFNGALAVELEK